MTFFLVKKNFLKNIKSVFNNSSLNIKKIILKSFADGVNLISNSKLDNNFTILRLEKNRINISLFKNKSFIYTENFNFGFDLILKDISKLCSLKIEEVQNLIKDIVFKHTIENNNNSYLEKKYKYSSPYRKIKYQLILDIIKARIDELFEICYKKNTNIKNLKNSDTIHIYVDSCEYYQNIQYILESCKHTTLECIFDSSIEENFLGGVNGASELIGKGWEKEAIPITHKKKSIISGFFSRLFS